MGADQANDKPKLQFCSRNVKSSSSCITCSQSAVAVRTRRRQKGRRQRRQKGQSANSFNGSPAQWDDKSVLADYADLLRRYLSQPLSDSETAWAYRTLANVLVCGERPAEAVDVHDAFERWLPGHSPRLSAKFPWYPASEDSHEPIMGPDELRLDVLSQSAQVATTYGALGRYADYVAKFDNALAQLTPTRENIELRVDALGISLCASQLVGDFERAERCLPLMDAIANEETDADSAARLLE